MKTRRRRVLSLHPDDGDGLREGPLEEAHPNVFKAVPVAAATAPEKYPSTPPSFTCPSFSSSVPVDSKVKAGILLGLFPFACTLLVEFELVPTGRARRVSVNSKSGVMTSSGRRRIARACLEAVRPLGRSVVGVVLYKGDMIEDESRVEGRQVQHRSASARHEIIWAFALIAPESSTHSTPL